jgi:hypothetical protein
MVSSMPGNTGYASADTLVSAMNPRGTEKERAAHPGVPDPHPCSVDPLAPHDRDEHYCELVNCVEMHKCRVEGYCHSSKCLGCRFGYPFELCTKTRLSFEKTKNGTVKATIAYKRNDPNINRHNRTMLEYWKANVDITIIIDYHAAVSYLTKYISKPESKGRQLESLFRAALVNATENTSPQSRFRSVMIKSIEGKNVGKFEACRQLMGGKMWSCSATFVKLPLDIGTRVLSRNENGEINVEETLIFYFKNRHDQNLYDRINNNLDPAEKLLLREPECYQEFASMFTLGTRVNMKNGFKIGVRNQ